MKTLCYAQYDDLDRCQASMKDKMPITITGLNLSGKIRAYVGIVIGIETSHAEFANYPLRVAIDE